MINKKFGCKGRDLMINSISPLLASLASSLLASSPPHPLIPSSPHPLILLASLGMPSSAKNHESLTINSYIFVPKKNPHVIFRNSGARVVEGEIKTRG